MYRLKRERSEEPGEGRGAEEEALGGDVLDHLEQLQRVADEIDRLEAKRRESTEERDRIQENLQEAERILAEQETRAHEFDMGRRKLELSVKADKDKMARVKSRLGDVKTSREYQAVLAEISATKQSVGEHEEALAREAEELEKVNAEIEVMQEKIRGVREDLEAAEASLGAVLEEVEPSVVQCRAQEETLLKSMPREVVDRYRLIRSRRGGLAVVEARDEACTACFMRIPPQLYIEVIRRSRVVQCPNCHRILIPPSPEQE